MKDLFNASKASRILRVLSGLALLAVFEFGISCATTALSTMNTSGSVKVFELGQRIPRNSKILDILDASGNREYRFLAGSWDSIGSCRFRQIIRHLKKEVKALGGDAIALLHINKAGFCHEIKAFLLDLFDIGDWPRIVLTEEEVRHDLEVGGRTLDDIEGIWASNTQIEVMMDDAALRVAAVYEGSQKRVLPSVIKAMEQLSPEQQSSFQIAIVKAAGDPDYPYAAYILDPEIPEWQAGFLKARLRKLPDSSGYEAKWYGSTFQPDQREFHPDETGALTTKVVIEQGLEYSIEQTLMKVYPPQR